MQQRQGSLVSARIVPYQPRPNARVDRLFLLLCSLLAGAVVVVLLTLAIGSVIDVWPYNLSFSLRHWDLNRAAGGGYTAFGNSLRMSAYSAVVGTLVVFLSAYIIEKSKPWPRLRQLAYFASTLPVALPGLVLGLAYIFFFNPAVWRWGNLELANPFHGLYNTMALLVICNVVHFYTVSFLTATTALRQLDPEFEAVAASMGIPFWRTLYRVTTPLCLPALLQIGFYFFVMSMVTVSAVIFLYPSDLRLASVAVVNMDDAGNTASAAAMSTLIVISSLMVQSLYSVATQKIRVRTQAWLKR